MICRDCVELLVDYADGALSDESRAALEEHLSWCAPCVAFVRTYKATSRVCRTALARNMPEDVSSRLHDFLDKNIAVRKA